MILKIPTKRQTGCLPATVVPLAGPTPTGPHFNFKEKKVVSSNWDCHCLVIRAPSPLANANYILSLNLFLIVFAQQGNYSHISCFINTIICLFFFCFDFHGFKPPHFKLKEDSFLQWIKRKKTCLCFCFLFFLFIFHQ